MTWIPLLLADPSPSLRYLVLRDLLHKNENDSELLELKELQKKDPLITNLVKLQATDGAWEKGDFVGGAHSTKPYATAQALTRLGYLGFTSEYSPVRKGIDYLLSIQNADGSWSLPKNREKQLLEGGYEKMTLQTAIPLRALAMCGYIQDSVVEKAYEWILEQQMDDGAWPTGYLKGNFGYVAGYRKIAHSRWGCRSNSTGALTCLALHPKYKNSASVKKSLDLLLGRDTQEQFTFGFEVARTIGVEQATGFITYYARFDPSLMLDISRRIGANTNDSRVNDLVDFVKENQGTYGLWEYTAKPHASRWITFDILRSLSEIDKEINWFSLEPKTPFQAYPKAKQRH